MKKILTEISYKLSKVVDLLERLATMTARTSKRPIAWLDKKNYRAASRLRMEDPELYNYIMKILKLYFS